MAHVVAMLNHDFQHVCTKHVQILHVLVHMLLLMIRFISIVVPIIQQLGSVKTMNGILC